MALFHNQFHTEGIALLSYLIGDDATGEAAVIDPRPDPEIYLEEARKRGVAITHILETHIHADFMSGSRELATQCPGAEIYLSSEGGARYGFEHRSLRDGDRLELGEAILTARHTPGHTPEHLSYEAAEKDCPDQPWGVFTGDALFVGSAGRPDLLGADEAEQLAGDLYDTLYGYFFDLNDEVIILPAHGAGSPCGADIGARMVSSIGYEKRLNVFLQYSGRREDFVTFALDAPDEPTYYQRMKKLNATGPEPTHGLPRVEGLSPRDFRKSVSALSDVNLLDTRSVFSFGGGHVPGAMNIWAKPMLSLWAGWMVDPEKDIYLILDDDTELNRVVRLLTRVGLTRFGGYLVGGMDAWATAGLPLENIPQMPVHELMKRIEDDAGGGLHILDVRSQAEFEEGSIDGAINLFVPHVHDHAAETLDKKRPIATYCGSGYRASIAASILKRNGFPDVRNVPGSWQAWQKLENE